MKEYVCLICGFVYSEEKGHPESGIKEGAEWQYILSDWTCPLCGAPKEDFREVKSKKSKIEEKKIDLVFEKDDSLRAAELSVIFSNISMGFEKQYKAEEASLAKELAEYYEKRTPEISKSFKELVSAINEELEKKYPLANSVASDEKDRGALRVLTWGEKATRMVKSILNRYEKEGDDLLKGVDIYVCDICGYIYIGNDLPEICPVCKVPKFKLLKVGG